MKFLSQINKLDETLSFALLSAIKEMPKNLGYTKTIDFLKGNNTKFIIDNKLQNNFLYGYFSSFSTKILRIILEYLVEKKYIKLEVVGIFKRKILKITKLGTEKINKKVTEEINLELFSKKEKEVIVFKNYTLYFDLVKLRKEISKSKKIPAYIVCSNNALVEIANKKPKTIKGYLEIKGIGENFLGNYMEEFNKIIHQKKYKITIEDKLEKGIKTKNQKPRKTKNKINKG